jgi:hypothetical protein
MAVTNGTRHARESQRPDVPPKRRRWAGRRGLKRIETFRRQLATPPCLLTKTYSLIPQPRSGGIA